MSLSTGSRLLREGCSQKKLGAQAGSCKNRSENKRRVAGWRCEVKSDVAKVEEMICRGPKSAGKQVGGPAAAARRAVHDAMLMCEAAQSIDVRARSDFLLLSRYVSNLCAHNILENLFPHPCKRFRCLWHSILSSRWEALSNFYTCFTQFSHVCVKLLVL